MEKPEEKTTRRRGDEMDRRSKKLRPVGEEKEEVAVAEDEEVEEFFAILRRMHDAVKHFQKANVGGSKVASGVLRKALETDTVSEVKVSAVAVETTPEQREKGKAKELFDLNSVPEPSNGGGDAAVCE